MGRRTAFVTGASRGIGKAIAVELAAAGYDVAVTARTVHQGESREHSSTLARSDTSPLPGSLDETSALVRAAGQECLVVPADLLDHASLDAAAATVLEAWGRVDVLVNNGRYVGPGHMDLVLDTPVEVLRDHFEANVLAPVVLVQALVPAMIEQGGGTVIDITSGAGYGDPPAPAGKGGWGFGYGGSKGALHRLAGILALELGDTGVRVFNVQPGFIATERIAQDMAAFGFDASSGAPAAVIGKVCRWLLESPEAEEWNGRNVEAQELCSERGLLPGWSLPAPPRAGVEGFDHVAITVADVDATVDFYRRVLGAEPLFLDRWQAGEMPVALLQVGGSRMSVHPAAAPASPHAAAPTPGSADLCFRDDRSVAELVAALQTHGVAVEEGPVPRPASNGERGTSVYFRDPDGNLLELLTLA